MSSGVCVVQYFTVQSHFTCSSCSPCEVDTPSNVHLNSAPPSPSTPSLSQDVTVERLEERVAELEGELSSRDEGFREKLRLKEQELRKMHEKETERGNDHKVWALYYVCILRLLCVYVCLLLFVCLCQ